MPKVKVTEVSCGKQSIQKFMKYFTLKKKKMPWLGFGKNVWNYPETRKKGANFLSTNANSTRVIILWIPLGAKANFTPAWRKMLQQAADLVTLNRTQSVQHQTSAENT